MTNPYAPPRALDDAIPTQGRIDGAEATRIAREIRRLNALSLWFGAPGLALQVAGNTIGGVAGASMTLAGFALLITGLSYYARMRGQSPFWGLAGILSCLGMILLFFLPKHCHHCQARTRGPTCDKCGAPAPM